MQMFGYVQPQLDSIMLFYTATSPQIFYFFFISLSLQFFTVIGDVTSLTIGLILIPYPMESIVSKNELSESAHK